MVSILWNSLSSISIYWSPHCFISPQAEADHLKRLFEKYVESTLNFKKSNCKELIPITGLNGVTSLCRLYDSLATSSNGVWQL